MLCLCFKETTWKCLLGWDYGRQRGCEWTEELPVFIQQQVPAVTGLQEGLAGEKEQCNSCWQWEGGVREADHRSILWASDLPPQCRGEQRALFILLGQFYLGFFMWVVGEGIITGAIIIQPDVWLMKYIALCCLRSWWLVDSSRVAMPVCVIWVTRPFERQCSASLYSLFGKVSWANK